MSGGDAESAARRRAPGFGRRIACMLYEGVLLFGVVMVAGLLYAMLTGQRHALIGVQGLRVFLFGVLGLYFVWFWTRSGQTLAMKTWHLRLVTRDGQRLGALRACCRYVASWLWFVPALATLGLTGVASGPITAATLLAGALLYVMLARLHPSRQYLHDLLCGTRLVQTDPPPKHTDINTERGSAG